MKTELESTFEPKAPFEPKTKSRFIVTFPDNVFKIPDFVVYEMSNIHCTFYNGLTVWEPITFKLYDHISPSTSQAIMTAIQDNDGYITTDDSPVDVHVKLLGPIGDVVSEWKLIGKINSIDFGSLSWKDTEHLTIELKFNVHHAILLY